MKRIGIAFGTFVVIAVVAALGAWWLASRDRSTTPVRASEVPTLVGVTPDADVDAGDRPPAGTYAYRGSGSDSFSGFGGDEHAFPHEISVVVELDRKDACAWTLHVVFVREHVERRDLCTVAPGTLRETGFVRRTEFLGHVNESTYECGDDAWRIPPDARTGATWSWSCREARGGRIDYAGELLGARHVRIVGTQDDEKGVGRERTELWLRSDGLPHRFTTDRRLAVKTPLGEMVSAERWDYRVVSTSP